MPGSSPGMTSGRSDRFRFDFQTTRHRDGSMPPLPPRSGGEGSRVGGASANSLPEEQADRPPTPDPPPPRAARAGGRGEEGERLRMTVRASSAPTRKTRPSPSAAASSTAPLPI